MTQRLIYADFQNLDEDNRLRLNCTGTLEDMKREKIELREGLRITFYMDDAEDSGNADDLRVDGTVQFDPNEKCWVAAVDWSKVRHASDDGSIEPEINRLKPHLPAQAESFTRPQTSHNGHG